MALVLTKGETLDLTKTDNSLTKLRVGLGWDTADTGAAFDLDAHAFLLNADGKTRSDKDVVYFGQKSVENGAVRTLGDNRKGEGEGDDETILIDLTALPAEIQKVAIAVDIYEGKQRNQNFAKVQNEFVRLVNDVTGEEIARFEPQDEGNGNHTAIIFGEVYRNENGWSFKAIGETLEGNLSTLIAKFGHNLMPFALVKARAFKSTLCSKSVRVLLNGKQGATYDRLRRLQRIRLTA